MNVTPAGVEAIANYGILTLTGQDAGQARLAGRGAGGKQLRGCAYRTWADRHRRV